MTDEKKGATTDPQDDKYQGKDIKLNGYLLARNWFNWSFEHPEKVTPTHTALYCWLIELNNKLGWVTNFSAPSTFCMNAIGIKSYNTFRKTFLDLISWGFVLLIKKSQNQYTANVIALSNFNKATNEALNNALLNYNKANGGVSKFDEANESALSKFADHVTKQLRHNKTTNKETTKEETPPEKNPAPTRKDFIGLIIQEFKSVFTDYVVTTPGKDRSAAGIVFKIFKGFHPDFNTEQMLCEIRAYFVRCKNIQDAWYKNNMSLTIAAYKYNEIQNTLNNSGKKKIPQDLQEQNYESKLADNGHN